MLPTLHEKGDLLLVDKLSIRVSPLRRSEVVVCKSPTRSGQFVCKRVVGVVSTWLQLRGRGRRARMQACCSGMPLYQGLTRFLSALCLLWVRAADRAGWGYRAPGGPWPPRAGARWAPVDRR